MTVSDQRYWRMLSFALRSSKLKELNIEELGRPNAEGEIGKHTASTPFKAAVVPAKTSALNE